jgi:hypothetical protein
MARSTSAERRLRKAGFVYDERLDAWFNLATERAISAAVIRKSPYGWVAAWLSDERGRDQRNGQGIARPDGAS